MKKSGITLIILVLAALAAGWFMLIRKSDTTKQADTKPDTSQSTFDKGQHSLDEPDSLWAIVNKKRPLQPAAYVPDGLVYPNVTLRLTNGDREMLMRTDAAQALEVLAKAAKDQANLDLMLASAYRSYIFQENLYNRYVSQEGQVAADTQSARPGYSEHQTGLAADIEPATRECEIELCFADMPEGKWIAKNAYKYGFVIRYHKGKDSVTGYMYEPWHLRYVGKDLATAVHDAGDPTLEEFFELGKAGSY